MSQAVVSFESSCCFIGVKLLFENQYLLRFKFVIDVWGFPNIKHNPIMMIAVPSESPATLAANIAFMVSSVIPS